MAISDTTVYPAATPTSDHSYVDWPAILAGTAVATAISVVLLTFGSALGLSMASAHENRGISLAGIAIAAALWLIWVQVSACFSGGYLAGRLRRRAMDATEHESDIRDGSHGVVVWALGLLIGSAIAFSGVSSALSTATGAATTVVAGAAAGGAAAAGDMLDQSGLSIDKLLRGASGTAPANGAQPASPEDQRAEIGRILASSVASGTLDPADKQYLIDTVAARTGVDSDTATKRVDELWAQAQATEAKVREAADNARKMAVLAAFITAASLLVSGAGAYMGAVLGGNHRDKQTIVEGWVKTR